MNAFATGKHPCYPEVRPVASRCMAVVAEALSVAGTNRTTLLAPCCHLAEYFPMRCKFCDPLCTFRLAFWPSHLHAHDMKCTGTRGRPRAQRGATSCLCQTFSQEHMRTVSMQAELDIWKTLCQLLGREALWVAPWRRCAWTAATAAAPTCGCRCLPPPGPSSAPRPSRMGPCSSWVCTFPI